MANVKIGIIGYGEVGSIFGQGLREKDGVVAVHAWDLKFAGPEGALHRDAAHAQHIVPAIDMADLCANADLLISAVTASNTLAVSQEAAQHLRPETVFLDLNSASPGTKRQAALAIETADGKYVEAGVMTSVPPYGIRVPMLLGGMHAQALAATLNAWGMDTQVVADKLGVASAIKMSRSIMIKGLEALVIEAYTNARAYGVEQHVLPTLQETFPQIDWDKQGAYFFSRVVQHGKRRAEEMRESANTVAEAGFTPIMASAIAAKHDWVAGCAREGLFDGLTPQSPWQDYADRLLAQRNDPTT